MKNILFVLIFLLYSKTLISQNQLGKTEDLGRIVISTYVSNQNEEISANSSKLLVSKLDQITTKYGLGGSDSRFIIVPIISELEKVVTSTQPTMVVVKLNVTLYIGDGVDGIKYSSFNTTIKGVGETESKAYTSAINSLKVDDQSIGIFITNAKKKIIEYYNSKCDFIITRAKTKSNMDEFDEAIFELMEVPEVCKDCYEKTMVTVNSIYTSKINKECKILLLKSKSMWQSGQDLVAAKSVSSLLSNIDPYSSCFLESKKMMEEVGKRVKALGQREWNFKLKVYEDDVNRKKDIINSARQIGITFGLNQPKVIYNFNVIRSW